MEAFLYLLSLCYGLVTKLRSLAYTCGIFRRRKLPVRVISVGNITLGGTGKTPAVMHIADMLRRNGKRPAVISRGYGRADESEIVVVSDGASTLVNAETGGDEPALIASRITGMPVVVGRDRYQAGIFAVRRFSPDIVILDDGFQHLRLRRDHDIVLIDGSDPFGNGKLFPAGILREPLSALGRAGAVLITRSEQAGDLDSLKNRVRQYTKAPVFTSRYVPVYLVDATTGEERPLAALRGTPVLAFAGIARPASFALLLRSLGADIKALMSYPDHYAFRKSDLAGLYQKVVDAGAVMIVTTEKDAVRLRDMKPEGIWALRIDLEVLEKNEWEEVLLRRP